MKLLVSVLDETEAREAVEGGVDIVDVKNPVEGALGASLPRIVEAVKKVVPKNVELSMAVGDVPDLPGTVSLAVLGAIQLGVDYVKVGLYGPRTIERAYCLMKEVCEVVKFYGPKTKIVLTGYADFRRVGCLSPQEILKVAEKVDIDVLMIDTKVKDGKSSFEFLDENELKSFTKKAHQMNLTVALAGSLSKNDVMKAGRIGVDIVGFRSTVCGGDRINGRVQRKLVEELTQLVSKF